MVHAYFSHALGLRGACLIAGKMLPPFPGDAATEPEVSTDGSEAASGVAAEVVASTETVVTAVMAEADRIIAAAKEGEDTLMAGTADR